MFDNCKLRFRRKHFKRNDGTYAVMYPSVNFSVTYNVGSTNVSDRRYYVDFVKATFFLTPEKISREVQEFIDNIDYWDDFWIKLHSSETESELVDIAIRKWENREPFLLSLQGLDFFDFVKLYAFFQNALSPELLFKFRYIGWAVMYCMFPYLNVCSYKQLKQVLPVIEHEIIGINYYGIENAYTTINENGLFSEPKIEIDLDDVDFGVNYANFE